VQVTVAMAVAGQRAVAMQVVAMELTTPEALAMHVVMSLGMAVQSAVTLQVAMAMGVAVQRAETTQRVVAMEMAIRRTCQTSPAAEHKQAAGQGKRPSTSRPLVTATTQRTVPVAVAMEVAAQRAVTMGMAMAVAIEVAVTMEAAAQRAVTMSLVTTLRSVLARNALSGSWPWN